MMEELECDRIWLSQFHNGGNFYPTGKSIQKFSVFYEFVTPGTPSIKSIFQNIPVSLFNQPMSHLYENGELSDEDIKNGIKNIALPGAKVITTRLPKKVKPA